MRRKYLTSRRSHPASRRKYLASRREHRSSRRAHLASRRAHLSFSRKYLALREEHPVFDRRHLARAYGCASSLSIASASARSFAASSCGRVLGESAEVDAEIFSSGSQS